MPSEAPWLDLIEADGGTHEVAGAKANPKILAYFEDVGHPECKSDEIAWCAARVGSALKRSGLPIPPVNVNLMARSYLTWGIACEPKRGAIIVLPRGNSTWQGHVGVVTKVYKRTVDYVAGNQSDQVGYGKANIDDALGFRWPVEPTIPALREAGSTEVKQGDRMQKVGLIATITGPIIAAIKEMWAPMAEIPKFATLPEGLSFWQQVLEGVTALARLIGAFPWVAAAVIAGLMLAWGGHILKKQRLGKHAAGAPLSAEVAKLAEAG